MTTNKHQRPQGKNGIITTSIKLDQTVTSTYVNSMFGETDEEQEKLFLNVFYHLYQSNFRGFTSIINYEYTGGGESGELDAEIVTSKGKFNLEIKNLWLYGNRYPKTQFHNQKEKSQKVLEFIMENIKKYNNNKNIWFLFVATDHRDQLTKGVIRNIQRLFTLINTNHKIFYLSYSGIDYVGDLYQLDNCNIPEETIRLTDETDFGTVNLEERKTIKDSQQ